jgi:hypothetical protein
MKYNFRFSIIPIIFIGLLAFAAFSCSKSDSTDEPAIKTPSITTATVNNISASSASSGGTITDNGGAAVTARGVCWDTTRYPTIANTKTTDGTGSGSYTSSITGLLDSTRYYVRAYATNSAGTGYGPSIPFTTFMTTYGRDEITGSWRFEEVPLSQVLKSTYVVQMKADSSNYHQLLLENFGNPSTGDYPAIATLAYNQLTVPRQHLGNGWIMGGVGKIVSLTKINWKYYINDGNDSLNYVATATKQ